MAVALSDHARLAIAWSENTAGAQISACATEAALCDWIVKNRGHLYQLEIASAQARSALQLKINKRFGEFDA